MSNPFDQFDSIDGPDSAANPFDQFDSQAIESDPAMAAATEAQQQERIDALPELEGILAGQDKLKVASLVPVLLTTTDPAEFGQILNSNFPDIGVVQTPEGEMIAYNNRTNQAASINKPGLSKADIIQGLGVVSAFWPAGMASQIPRQLSKRIAAGAASSGATQTGIEAAQTAAGGDFSGAEVGLATGLGGAAEVIMPGLSAARQMIRPSAREGVENRALAQQAAQGLKDATGESVELLPAQKSMLPDEIKKQAFLPQLKGAAAIAQKRLQKQNEQVYNATVKLIEQTGAADSLTKGALRFKEASEKAVKKAKKDRSRITSPMYNAAFRENPIVDTEPVKLVIDNALDKFPENGKIYKTIKKVEGTIGNTKNLQLLHGAKMDIDALLEPLAVVDGSSIGNTTRRQLTDIKQALVEQMVEASPSYGQANAKFADLSPAVDDVTKGSIGKAASKEKLKVITKDIFDPQKKKKKTIESAKRLITEIDPKAWDDILAIEMQRRIGGLMNLLEETPEAVANTPTQIKKALFGTPPTRKALLSAMSPQQKANFRYLETVLSRAAAGRTQGSATAAREAIRDGIRGVPGLVRAFIISP